MFINDVDEACNNEDLFFLIFLLQADEIADSATESLTQAYDNLENVCVDNRKPFVIYGFPVPRPPDS